MYTFSFNKDKDLKVNKEDNSIPANKKDYHNTRSSMEAKEGHVPLFCSLIFKTSAVCGPHLQPSAAEEVDQTSVVCKKKTFRPCWQGEKRRAEAASEKRAADCDEKKQCAGVVGARDSCRRHDGQAPEMGRRVEAVRRGWSIADISLSVDFKKTNSCETHTSAHHLCGADKSVRTNLKLIPNPFSAKQTTYYLRLKIIVHFEKSKSKLKEKDLKSQNWTIILGRREYEIRFKFMTNSFSNFNSNYISNIVRTKRSLCF
ncbi:hypothetical protein LXL04_013671 [Taraxacum kok-saghyz]